MSRFKLVVILIYLSFFAISTRLFYWQVIKEDELKAQATEQYQRTVEKSGQRGSIFTADNYPLVTNHKVYRLYAQPHLISDNHQEVANHLADILYKLESHDQNLSNNDEILIKQELSEQLLIKLTKPNTKWVSLYQTVPEEVKTEIEELNHEYLGFETIYERWYPESSMAAQLTGFVAKNNNGEDVGYFGLEGALDQELRPRSLRRTVLTDALGAWLSISADTQQSLDGRDVTVTIRRDVQYLLERKLLQGMEQYGARAGEIIVMEPQTGRIIGQASFPSYDQTKFSDYETDIFKNQSLTSLYEPGSTFKVLTVATGIDAGAITPETICDRCAGPRVFGQYTIKTWNEVYNPNITMTDALAKSDNIAMIFASEKVGSDKFKEYIQNFGLGQSLELDLQGDRDTPFPEKWGPVELATISFGQGISATSLQLLRAINTIANNGIMVKPQIVQKVTDKATGKLIEVQPEEIRRVVHEDTARQVRSMMVEAANHGEAQWTASADHWVAGKTGTSQVPLDGGYAESDTIASFIGFTPPDNPKFIMLVKLVAPQSSPWAAETAAPLWYDVADDLYLLLGVPPDRL